LPVSILVACVSTRRKRLVRVMFKANSSVTIEKNPPRLACGMKEGAASIGLSEAYLYKLHRAGLLKLVRIGKRTLLPESERQRLIAEATN